MSENRNEHMVNFGQAPYFPVPTYNRMYYEEHNRRPGSLYSK